MDTDHGTGRTLCEREEGHQQAKERAWNIPPTALRSQPCLALDLGPLVSRTMRQNLLLLEPLALWYIVTTALANSYGQYLTFLIRIQLPFQEYWLSNLHTHPATNQARHSGAPLSLLSFLLLPTPTLYLKCLLRPSVQKRTCHILTVPKSYQQRALEKTFWPPCTSLLVKGRHLYQT